MTSRRPHNATLPQIRQQQCDYWGSDLVTGARYCRKGIVIQAENCRYLLF
jgi:hypothetical protein